MSASSRLGISIKYESRTIFRNVQPVEDIITEFNSKNIKYVSISPEVMKYGNWDIVVAFDRDDSYQLYQDGKIRIDSGWLSAGQQQAQKINPLKASKRAHAKK